MIDLIPNFRKISTSFGAAVTILVISSACSSKQVLNEVVMPEPVEYNEPTAPVSAYVDHSELPQTQATSTPKKKKRLAKKSRVKKSRQARKNKIDRIEEESARPVIGSIESSNFPDDGALKAAAVTVGATQEVAPPAPPELPLPEPVLVEEGTLDQPLMVSDLVFNWYFLVGALLVGLAGWFTFARRKAKRSLVFN